MKFFLFIALCCLFISSIGTKCEAKRPHIVMFVIDDLGWTDVGYRNGSGMLTPNLDSLKESGITLDRYYTQPTCSPSRAALMQGRYPFRTGLQHYTTIKPASTAHMPLDQPTLPELLGKAQYHSHHVGKWHLGYASFNYTPTARGFLSHAGYYQGMVDYYNKTFRIPQKFLPFVKVEGYDWWHNRTVATKVNGTFNLFLMEDQVNNVLNNYQESGADSRDEPLFLYYAHQIVHVPLEVPQEYIDYCHHINDTNRQIYCGMLYALDLSIAKFIQTLKDKNMWDDTLLIVSTDNGGDPDYGSYPESAGCNFPLRAGKGTVFEGGVRSIGFVNGGDNVIPASRRGSTIDGLAHIVDWMPTILNAAQAGDLLPDNVDGVDLTDAILKGKETQRVSIPLDINFNVSIPDSGQQYSVLMNDGWKLVHHLVQGKTLNYDGWYPCLPSTPIPIEQAPDGNWLFNVFEDPEEKNNLYSTRPDQVERLTKVLNAYVKSGYMAPQPDLPHPDGFPQYHDGVWAPFLDS